MIVPTSAKVGHCRDHSAKAGLRNESGFLCAPVSRDRSTPVASLACVLLQAHITRRPSLRDQVSKATCRESVTRFLAIRDPGNAAWWFHKAIRPVRSVDEIDPLWTEITAQWLDA